MRKFMSRQAMLAAAAARAAMRDFNPFQRGVSPERVGLYASVGLASINHQAGLAILRESAGPDGTFDSARFFERGTRAVNPLLAFEVLANMPACVVSVLEGIKGESAIYTPYEDSGAQALMAAAEALAEGRVDLALVVAADTPDEPSSLSELALLGHLGEGELAAATGAALALTRSFEGGSSRPGLRDFRLVRAKSGAPPWDPLADRLGRSMAAAPAILAILAAMAPELGLETRVRGYLGHELSFTAARP
jgi:hypothetical protein